MQADTTAEQLKNEFRLTLSKFAHEIRNPIALINSELQLMVSSHPELADYTQWSDLMDNLEYIKALLNEFSDYNNAEKLTLHSVNPGEFLHSVLSSEKTTLNYLGIALETEIDDRLPQILIDRIKMRQALINLLRNARESITHPNGQITVSLHSADFGVCISVKDNGCGMTDRQLENIFSPFVTSKSEGTGLGLAIAEQIVKAHGGSIEASSQPGQGSVFKIFLG